MSNLAWAMGTNTMVAAVGLVIGPVLGGALVDISWHWGLLVQRAFRSPRERLGVHGPTRAEWSF